MSFRLTARQSDAQAILASGATYIMLFGGSRSGKTFLLVRTLIIRALKAADSRHAILRFRFNHVKNSIVFDTFPKVMRLCFPGVSYRLDKTNWLAELPNGAQIWFGGLDDKERTEKILGMEFVTIYLNECSQIPWSSVGIAITRLAQKVRQKVAGMPDRLLPPRMLFDCNPPSKAHWSYQIFILKRDPDTRLPLANPGAYAHFQINPQDNAQNLPENYLDTLKSLGARLRRRFLDGEFADATPNALFTDETIETWRHTAEMGELPDLVRVVVGVDPSGADDTDNADNDEIGIVAGALATDGNAYLLEDVSVKAGPAVWGRVATELYERQQADLLVAERNFGGAMVGHVVRTAKARVHFKLVTASRGKAVRAEPFSALYEQGKIRHVGIFRELEDELTAFSTTGYTGERSPNRADAWIWVLSELFPGMVRARQSAQHEPEHIPPPPGTRHGWMG